MECCGILRPIAPISWSLSSHKHSAAKGREVPSFSTKTKDTALPWSFFRQSKLNVPSETKDEKDQRHQRVYQAINILQPKARRFLLFQQRPKTQHCHGLFSDNQGFNITSETKDEKDQRHQRVYGAINILQPKAGRSLLFQK